MGGYRVLFVTGVSCAGKSVLAQELRRRLGEAPDVRVVDVDQDGTPDAGHGPWLNYRAEQLLHDATHRARSGISTVICGIVLPHRLIDSTTWDRVPRGVHVGWLLLDVTPTTLRDRLRRRLVDEPSATYRELLRSNRELAVTLRKQVSNRRDGVVVKSDVLMPTQLASQVLDLLHR